jgi:hypothetical protein
MDETEPVEETDWAAVVAEQTCEECGLRASEVPRASLPDALRSGAADWAQLLSSSADDALRAHPVPGWSALEYAAHVRDVLDLYTHRVQLVLAEDEPVLGWWDHEAAAVDEAYNEADPGEVGDRLTVNADGFAAVASAVEEGEWSRSATRRPGERFTVEGLVRFALHEVRHHHWDAERVLAGLG